MEEQQDSFHHPRSGGDALYSTSESSVGWEGLQPSSGDDQRSRQISKDNHIPPMQLNSSGGDELAGPVMPQSDGHPTRPIPHRSISGQKNTSSESLSAVELIMGHHATEGGRVSPVRSVSASSTNSSLMGRETLDVIDLKEDLKLIQQDVHTLQSQMAALSVTAPAKFQHEGDPAIPFYTKESWDVYKMGKGIQFIDYKHRRYGFCVWPHSKEYIGEPGMKSLQEAAKKINLILFGMDGALTWPELTEATQNHGSKRLRARVTNVLQSKEDWKATYILRLQYESDIKIELAAQQEQAAQREQAVQREQAEQQELAAQQTASEQQQSAHSQRKRYPVLMYLPTLLHQVAGTVRTRLGPRPRATRSKPEGSKNTSS